MPHADVYVLYTGGTFGMAPDDNLPGRPLTPLILDDILPLLPDPNELAGGDITVKFESLPGDKRIDSSSMVPADWIAIATKIYENYNKYDGFVVIQGTDTLSYTASALSFMFENLGKPIVVTGSQLPLKNSRTDARLNYGHAVMIAGYKATGLPRISEVVVVFADKILRGCRTRKMSASAWTGFSTPNSPPLGEIGEHVRIFENQLRAPPPPDREVQLITDLETRVLDISLYPGLQAEHLKNILSLNDVKGVVLRTYGTGNAPSDPAFLQALGLGILKDKKTVVNITQCPQGSVEMGLYQASVGLMDQGVISGLDMTPEAALTKLMVMLGSRDPKQVPLQMQINQRGEQAQSLFDLEFDRHVEQLEYQGRYSHYTIPDRKFEQEKLSEVVLRISSLAFRVSETTEGPLKINVFVNSQHGDMKRCVQEILLNRSEASKPNNVVEHLPLELVKNIIGDSEIYLTLIPSPGVTFSFEKLSLSLFTNA